MTLKSATLKYSSFPSAINDGFDMNFKTNQIFQLASGFFIFVFFISEDSSVFNTWRAIRDVVDFFL